jgi:hypothetical protein
MVLIVCVLIVLVLVLLVNQHKINRDLLDLEDTVEQLIDALAEDANADYQERVDRMFGFITEDLDPEEGS